MISGNLHEFFSYNIIQAITTVVATILLQTFIRHSIGRIIRRTVRRHKFQSKIDEQKREQTLIGIFHTASGVVLWTIAIIVILIQLEVNFTPILTGAGLFGVIIGLGAQSTLKDYIAGIQVILENQYRVGDIVRFGTTIGPQVSGVVEDITIRVTRLRDLDGNLHIIPNGSAGVVTNLSFEFANVNVDVNISYESDVDKAIEIIKKTGQEQALDDRWKDAIFEPIEFLRIDRFNDFSITVKSIGKVQPAMQWDIAGDFRYRIKKAFTKNNISIQLPQIVVLTTQRKPETK